MQFTHNTRLFLPHSNNDHYSYVSTDLDLVRAADRSTLMHSLSCDGGVSLLDVMPLHSQSIWYFPIGCRNLLREQYLADLLRDVNTQEVAQLTNSWHRVCRGFTMKFKSCFLVNSDDLPKLAFMRLSDDIMKLNTPSSAWWNKFCMMTALHDRLLWLFFNSASKFPSDVAMMEDFDVNYVLPKDTPVHTLYQVQREWKTDLSRYIVLLLDHQLSTHGSTNSYLDLQSDATDTPTIIPYSVSDEVTRSLIATAVRGSGCAFLMKTEVAFCHAALALRAALIVSLR